MAESLLTIESVAKLTALCRATIYRWVAAGRFPRPIQLGPRTVRWKSAEVDAWINGRSRTGEDDL